MSTALQTTSDQMPAVHSEASSLISLIERLARDPNSDVTKVERMVDMHERAVARLSKEAFYAALSQMQADLPAVARLGTGHNNKKYARFEDIIETVRPVLSKHGFSLTFRVKQDDKTMTTTGVLGHAQGYSESTEIMLPQDLSGNKNPVQAWGSSASYGKRYVTLTLLGIATEDEDDDGAGAIRGNRKSSAQSKRDGTSDRFNAIKALFESAPTLEALASMSREYRDEINAMPEKWATLLGDSWDMRKDELKATQG